MTSLTKEDIILIVFLCSIFLVGVPIFLCIYCTHRREQKRLHRRWERERRHREGSARYEEEGGFVRSESFVYLAAGSIGIESVTRV